MVNVTKKILISGNRIIGRIFVDDVTELPSSDGIDSYELIQGSVAYVIKSGELYVMGSDGKWYDTTGTAKE